ncbi:hypothetical protein ONE63_006984 [Megalurothrips usitatus]|uniref:NADH dehydrogenase [ubiquinone] 1 alpha subcomplex subunit 10, mitochondrial n=1 Tax=Megalurothrips usitatus TaxID=439358 RepID=A0AAV7XUT4_9NEOP|nr:hypothetical protein ONE63_006984 [Megalurothrips usitatus]
MSALRLVRPLCRNLRCQPSEQLLLRNFNHPRALCAFISSKANMAGYQRPAPFPYKEKKYNWWYQLFDRTIDRFDENSKVLVVDGPIAAGKSTFAKQLAEDLDMLYVPEADLAQAYINKSGYDLRQLNSTLPPNAQFLQYIDALAHLLHTGQGVVLDRSVYSDFVFMEAMFEQGYLSKNIKAYYEESFSAIQLMLKRPHLIIYLDVPVNIVQQRIKERNRPWEVNSPVLTEKYLSAIEKHYKLRFLRDMSARSEILMYDWSNFGDVEVVVEDIERINLDIRQYDEKFEDWKTYHDREYGYWRADYSNNKDQLLTWAEPGYILPEMMLTNDEGEILFKALEQIPGGKYEHGYEPKLGDKVFWKWS